MRLLKGSRLMGLNAAVIVLLLTGICYAQDGPVTYEAIARGTGQQMGRSYGGNVTVVIESFSTVDEQTALWDAFQKTGNKGLYVALAKLPSRGRISFTGEADYDVAYIKVLPTATGRKIRMVTRRPLTGVDTRQTGNFTDYNLSALELELSAEKGKSKGIFMPACQFKVNKDKEIEVEAYGYPWRLDNITEKANK